jgi:hypothetical protein
MEDFLKSLETHQGAAICLAIFIITVIGKIPYIVKAFKNNKSNGN